MAGEHTADFSHCHKISAPEQWFPAAQFLINDMVGDLKLLLGKRPELAISVA
jgi:hypothetical protein